MPLTCRFVAASLPKEYQLVSTRVRGFVWVPDGLGRFHKVWLSP